MVERRKISAAYRAFDGELKRLQRLDDLNQERFYPGPGRPGPERLSASQMHMLTEAIFARAFSRYEEYIEQVFLLYCQGRRTLSGKRVKSYIHPTSAKHARLILKSGMNFLEWNSADKIIERSKVYLEEDNPIYLAITSHQARLNRLRHVRNAIAHASEEAHSRFLRTVRDELGVAPLRTPTVGEFLIMRDRAAAAPQYFLRSYLDVLAAVALAAAG